MLPSTPFLLGRRRAGLSFPISSVGVGANATGSTSVAAPYYSGLAANDFALLFVLAATGTIGTPSGWSATGDDGGATGVRFAVFSKILTGSESGTVTCPVTGGTNAAARIFGFRGNVTQRANGGTNDTGSTSPAAYTVGDADNTGDPANALIISRIASAGASISGQGGPSAGYTFLGEVAGASCNLVVDSYPQPVAGTFPPNSRTVSAANWLAYWFSLTP